MYSIKAQIFLFLILPFMIIGSISFVFASIYVKDGFEKNLQTSAFIDAERISDSIKEATLSKDIPLLTRILLDERYSKTPSVSLAVFEPAGNVLAYTSLKAKPSPIGPTSSKVAGGTDSHKEGGHIFTLDQPITSGPYLIGMMRVTYDFTETMAQFDLAFYILFAISMGGLLTLSALMLRLSRTIIDPIAELSRIAANFTHGNMEVHMPVSGSKETVLLADSFNTMVQSIKQSQQDLIGQKNDLEQKVSELEAWQRATIDRELKMIQIKEELRVHKAEHRDRVV